MSKHKKTSTTKNNPPHNNPLMGLAALLSFAAMFEDEEFDPLDDLDDLLDIDSCSDMQTEDNPYAWREICENGVPYCVFKYDYDIEEEYEDALEEAKGLVSKL